jgi:transposase
MRTRTGPNGSADKHVREIKRKTRRKFSAEEKIRIVLDGLRGESSISELCRREGIAESLYYNWSRDFIEAGKKRLTGDTARQAMSSEVTGQKRETRDLKEAVAEQTMELRLLKNNHARQWMVFDCSLQNSASLARETSSPRLVNADVMYLINSCFRVPNCVASLCLPADTADN